MAMVFSNFYKNVDNYTVAFVNKRLLVTLKG